MGKNIAAGIKTFEADAQKGAALIREGQKLMSESQTLLAGIEGQVQGKEQPKSKK
jgi:hypothetical protein